MPTTPLDIRDDDTIVVVLDEINRLASVSVGALDPSLREPDLLASAFDEAWSDALGRTRPSADVVADDRDQPSVHRSATVKKMTPLPETPGRQPHWDLIRKADSRPRTSSLSPVGQSDNECLHVRLDPASSRGRLVDLETGWLANATPERLALAITQAFTHAYDQRTR